MNNESQYWLGFWRTVAFLIAVIVVTIAGCDIVSTKYKVDLLLESEDPIATSCAWTQSSGPVCMAKVIK